MDFGLSSCLSHIPGGFEAHPSMLRALIAASFGKDDHAIWRGLTAPKRPPMSRYLLRRIAMLTFHIQATTFCKQLDARTVNL